MQMAKWTETWEVTYPTPTPGRPPSEGSWKGTKLVNGKPAPYLIQLFHENFAACYVKQQSQTSKPRRMRSGYPQETWA